MEINSDEPLTREMMQRALDLMREAREDPRPPILVGPATVTLWCERHRDATEIVWDTKTHRPVKAVYLYTKRGGRRKYPAVYWYPD